MDPKRFRQILRQAFWIPFLIAVVVGAALILEVRFLMERAAWIEHTDQVIALAQRIYRNRVDQETGLRAYVLTGDERFLEPFYDARKRSLALEPELRQLIANNPEQTERNEQSFQTFHTWSSWADQAIAMTKAGEDPGDVKFQLRGKELMDGYRRTREEFIQREQQLRDERLARSRRALEFVNGSIVALAMLFALGFAVLGRKQLNSLSRSFIRSEESFRAAQEQSVADLEAMTRLHEVGNHCILSKNNLPHALDEVLDAAIAFTAADKGNIQLFDPASGALTIAVQRGFEEAFLRFFASVRDEHAACAAAMQREERVIVEDVTASEIFAGQPSLKVLLDAGVRAVQSTPLVSSAGNVLGMISTHFSAPHRPSERELRLIDLLARQTADYLERRKTEDAVRDQAMALELSTADAQSQQERLGGIISSAMDAIITVDEAQRIQVFNRAAEQIFRCPAAEAIGQPLDKFIPERFRDAHRQHIKGFGRTGITNRSMSSPGDLWARRSDGHEFPIEATISQVEVGGKKLFTVVLRDVTEKKQAEEALRESEQRFLQLAETIPQLAWMANPDGWIFWYNRRWYEYTGTTPQQMEGWGWQSVHDPHELPKVLDRWRESISTGKAFEMVFPLRGADGVFRPFLTRVEPLRDEQGKVLRWFGTNTDVTEQREAEAKLAEQAGLLELTSDAIIVRNELGRIAYWNKGAEELYGWSQGEAVGKITHDLLRTAFPQPLAEIVDRLRKERRWQGELIHTCKNGEQVTVLSRWALVQHEQDADAPRSLMEINTDITRRKQLEAALQSNERLALAGRLSASIAHEIHNPLDTVGNVLFLLSQQIRRQPGARKFIETAQREVQRVTEISKSMLSLDRESRSPSAIKLSELLESVVALIEETIAKGGRDIHVVPGFQGEVEAFPSELRQVFTNVIKNAIEATAEGGEITVFSEAVQEAGRSGVLVRVVDNGVGIREDMQSKLFNPFVSSKEESGTGLGLWVSRSIVERHGGTIRISSSSEPENRGTTVSIFLPLKAAPLRRAAGSTSAA